MSQRNKPKLPALKINAATAKGRNDHLRDQAGLNSPMATGVAAPAVDTPTDKRARAELDINSPKAGNDDVAFNPKTDPNSIMTQVSKDGKQSSAPDSIMTQVARPEKSASSKPAGKSKPKKSKSRGWCSCFAPAPTPDERPVELKKNTNSASQGGGAASTSKAETEEDIRREEAGLLGRRKPEHRDKKCLVIDLDETLVHSSFKAVDKCDFIVPVEIENVVHNVYVLVRPYAVEFLDEMAKHYEIVLFTASLAKYADPLLDLLDRNHTIDYRLFRDSCVQIGYSYVKDLSRLGRKMSEVMIIDNSPQSYRFQPCNAIPCTSWFDDPNDTELLDLIPVMKTTLKTIPDCRDILDAAKPFAWLCQQATKE